MMEEPGKQKPGDPRITMAAKQAEQQKAMQEEAQKAKLAFERLGNTEDGLKILRFFYELTGMRQSPIVINKQNMEVSEQLSMLIAGRQEVWRDLRPYISDELFCKIEKREVQKQEAK